MPGLRSSVRFAVDPRLAGGSSFVVRILDTGGRQVRALESSAQERVITWDARDQMGRPVPSGRPRRDRAAPGASRRPRAMRRWVGVPELVSLTLLATAFGYIEGAVVVYLRALLYPSGFGFPLQPIPREIYHVELVREAATLLLLFGAARLAAREPLRRFAAFSFAFGVWDLVYYVTLKAALDWPSSWLEWDILFLIPVFWVGPVLAPMLVACGLVVGGALFFLVPPGDRPAVRGIDWGVEIFAGLLVFFSFVLNGPTLALEEAPTEFPWWLYGGGLAVGVGWFAYRWAAWRRRSSRVEA